MPDEQPKLSPPYLPYKTLLSSLDNLGQGIPPKLDRSIWKNQPGTVQSQILSAYKFLGLMNDASGPTELLRELVQHRATPGPVMKKIIETKKKAVRFFLQATKANGFTLSKFLLDQTRVSAGTRKKRTKRDSDNNGDNGLDEDGDVAAEREVKTIALKSGGELSFSLTVDLFALSKDDREFV